MYRSAIFRRICLACCLLLSAGSLSASEAVWNRQKAEALESAEGVADRLAAEDLRQAWDQFMLNLQRARSALEDPAIFPAEHSGRNLAEGYRYLLGHLHRLIEAEVQQSPDYPYFQDYPSLVSKFSVDNADGKHLYAPIDPWGTYLLIGKAADSRHWRGKKRPKGKITAPHYATFETLTDMPGSTGTLGELFDGSRAVVSAMDVSGLQINDDGSFEIMISPSMPAGYSGNFLPSSAFVQQPAPDGELQAVQKQAGKLYIRQIFSDWENERALHLEIVKIGHAGEPANPRTASATGEQIATLGEQLNNQIRFWNRYYALGMEAFGDVNGDGSVAMPRNCLSQPLPVTDGLHGLSKSTRFSGGVFSLAPDEALVVTVPHIDGASYSGIHLANYWGESVDFANRHSSINNRQVHVDSDGMVRYVVASQDPGVPNWLDTTGLKSGYMAWRLLFDDPAAVPDEVPVRCEVMSQAAVLAAMPEDTPRVDYLERRRQIMLRQHHVARRSRQY